MKRTIIALALAAVIPSAHASFCLGLETPVLRSNPSAGFNVFFAGSMSCAGSSFQSGNTAFDPDMHVTVTFADGTQVAPRLISVRNLPPADPLFPLSPYTLSEDFLLPTAYEGTFNVRVAGSVHVTWDQTENRGETTFPLEHRFTDVPFSGTLSVVSHAPEPETWALMLVGLALLSRRVQCLRSRKS